jgi:hypothetical protein
MEKILTKIDKLENNMQCKIDKLENNMKGEIDKLEKNMKGEIDKLEKNMKDELAVTNNIVKEMNYTVKANYNTTKKMKKNLKNGIGFAFEHLNASWLKTHLSALNQNVKIKVQLNKKFNDNIVNKHDRVNEKTPEFEVDIYVENPFVIAECTSQVNKIEKVQKLKRIQEFFMREKKQTASLYFFTYSIIDDIKEKVENYCRENGITLIIQKEESSEDEDY